MRGFPSFIGKLVKAILYVAIGLVVLVLGGLFSSPFWAVYVDAPFVENLLQNAGMQDVQVERFVFDPGLDTEIHVVGLRATPEGSRNPIVVGQASLSFPLFGFVGYGPLVNSVLVKQVRIVQDITKRADDRESSARKRDVAEDPADGSENDGVDSRAGYFIYKLLITPSVQFENIQVTLSEVGKHPRHFNIAKLDHKFLLDDRITETHMVGDLLGDALKIDFSTKRVADSDIIGIDGKGAIGPQDSGLRFSFSASVDPDEFRTSESVAELVIKDTLRLPALYLQLPTKGDPLPVSVKMTAGPNKDGHLTVHLEETIGGGVNGTATIDFTEVIAGEVLEFRQESMVKNPEVLAKKLERIAEQSIPRWTGVLSSEISGSINDWRSVILDAANFKAGSSDFSLRGKAKYGSGDLSFELDATSKRFVLRDFFPFAASAAAGASERSADDQADGVLFPDDQLDLAGLNDINGHFRFQADLLGLPWVGIRRTDVEIQFDDGVIHTSRMSANLGGSPVSGKARIDVSDHRLDANVEIKTAGVDLAAMTKDAGEPEFFSGTGTLLIDLETSGNSVNSLVGELDGKTRLHVENGSLNRQAVEQALGGALTDAMLPASKGDIAFKCLAFDAEVRKGQVGVPSVLMADSPAASIGWGAVDLPGEVMDMNFLPIYLAKRTGIITPVVVSGNLAKPEINLDTSSLASQLIDPSLYEERFRIAGHTLADLPDGHPCKKGVEQLESDSKLLSQKQQKAVGKVKEAVKDEGKKLLNKLLGN